MAAHTCLFYHFLAAVLWFWVCSNGLLSPKGVNFEVQALMGIKASLLDPHGLLENWDADAVDPCSWTMVTCSAESLVIGLGTPSQNLSGTLSPSIGNLTNHQIVERNADESHRPAAVCARLLHLSATFLAFGSDRWLWRCVVAFSQAKVTAGLLGFPVVTSVGHLLGLRVRPVVMALCRGLQSGESDGWDFRVPAATSVSDSSDDLGWWGYVGSPPSATVTRHTVSYDFEPAVTVEPPVVYQSKQSDVDLEAATGLKEKQPVNR